MTSSSLLSSSSLNRVHFHKVVFNMAPGELVSVSYHKELNTDDPNLEIPIFDHCMSIS